MALTLNELFTLTKDQYKLEFLSAKDELEHVVTWVHIMEDADITRLFIGNEVVVTTGYGIQKEEDFFPLIDTLIKSRSSALVINVGNYIKKIPSSVIDYCEQNGLPLITMPWKMRVTEFVKDCCYLILQSSREEEILEQTIMHLVNSPQDVDSYRGYLDQYFQEEQGFRMIAIRPERLKPLGIVTDHRRTLRIHSALRSFSFPYAVISHEHTVLILMNNTDRDTAEQLSQKLIRTIKYIDPKMSVHLGISESAMNYDEFPDIFHGAISAVRRAKLQHAPTVHFEDMGFYKLLYSVPNDALLYRYYHEVMDPLINYDKDNSDIYVETLFRYLLNDGHLKDVAEEMYVHRNTVNYRMGKIREILGCDLSSEKDRLPFLLAYHIGVILKLGKEY